MGCSMLFFSKPTDAGFLYTEDGSEADGVSLVSGTGSKLFSVVFFKTSYFSIYAASIHVEKF